MCNGPANFSLVRRNGRQIFKNGLAVGRWGPIRVADGQLLDNGQPLTAVAW